MARKRRPMPRPVAPPTHTDLGVSDPEVPHACDISPPDLGALVAAEVKKATAPPKEPTSVCSFCGWRYLPRGATREVSGRSACGTCIAWTDHSRDEPLTEEKILDSAVCKLVGRRTTLVGAASRVPIVPWYVFTAEPGTGQSKRWGHVDRDHLIADFDRAFPPSRVSGKVVVQETEKTAEAPIHGGKGKTKTVTYTERSEPAFVPGPPPPLQRSPLRPPTESERLREAIAVKRMLAEANRKQRSARMARATREMQKMQRRIAALAATNGRVPVGQGAER